MMTRKLVLNNEMFTLPGAKGFDTMEILIPYTCRAKEPTKITYNLSHSDHVVIFISSVA